MSWVILALVTLTASVLQTVTGFGFGLLCVPVFLWIIDSIAAIQLVTIVTLIMSIAIWPTVKHHIVRRLLFTFGLGCIIGSPIGILFFNQLNLNVVKMIAAIVIFTLTLWNAYIYLIPMIRKNRVPYRTTRGRSSVQTGVGVASGVLGSTLAMPAPLVMLYLSGTSYDKQQIRSTILVFFILAYGVALICQMLTQGVEKQTWETAVLLAPAALLGVYIGHKLSPRVNKVYFRMIVFLTLIITSVVMMINATGSWQP